MFEQQAQRKVNQQATSLRAKLFGQGKALEENVMRANTLFKTENTYNNKISLIFALGKLSGYLVLRQSLLPTISSDRAMITQSGLVNKICKEIHISHEQLR